MLKRNWKIIFVAISQLFDLGAIGISAWMVLALRGDAVFGTTSSDERLLTGLVVFSVLYIVLAIMMGLYRGSFHQSMRLQLMLVARTYLYSILISIAFDVFIANFAIGRRALVVFFSSLFLAFVVDKILLRVVNLLFQRAGLGVHPSLVVGEDEDSTRIVQRMSAFPELGYRIEGFITKKKNPRIGLHPQYHYNELDTVIKRKHIDRIFIPSTDMVVNGYSYIRDMSRKHGIKLKVLSPRSEQLLDVAKIYQLAGITLISPPRYRVNAAKQAFKRLFDIVGSLCIIIMISPVFILAILGIYIETGRPIFFLQRRSSIKGSKEFHFIKFRSMITNADELKEELQGSNHTDGALFKMKNDPRITRVGRIIRKYSIDELPQLFNVLKGDMSLVGPRPLPISDFCKAKEPDEFWEAVKERAAVKPGMTGLWQISGRSDIKFQDMILLDLYYVENYSLLFDLEILFETIPAVLFGKGAY